MQEGIDFLYCNICLSLTGDSKEYESVGYYLKWHGVKSKTYKEMYQGCPTNTTREIERRSKSKLEYYKTPRGLEHREITRNRYLNNNPMHNPVFRKNFNEAIVKPERIEAIRQSVLKQYRTGKKIPPEKFTYKYTKSGYFYSRKNDKSIFYRSSNERLAYEKLEEDDNVLKYEGNMFMIIPLIEGHSYFPDILATYKNGKKLLVEVKPYINLESVGRYGGHMIGTCDPLILKIEAAEKFCNKMEWKFQIWTDRCLKL